MKSGKMLTNIRKTCFHIPLAQQADRVVYLTMRLTNRNSVISLTFNSVCDIGWNSLPWNTVNTEEGRLFATKIEKIYKDNVVESQPDFI